MNNKNIKNTRLDWILLGGLLVLMIAWVMTTGKVGGPDEPMRYDVAKYIYSHHGQLPHGAEESIRNKTWGISYAFYPILSYMVSAVFMSIAGIFSNSAMVLLRAARMADVLFIMIAAWYTIRIGKRLFGGEKGRFFSILVIFMPGFVFLGTYVNTDSLALMAAAMILYAWVCFLDEGWLWKNCVLLAVGMGICFLSYYNAYGWILWSFFFFCVTVLFCGKQSMKERWKFLFSRGLVIAAITLGISAWWFVRNYFLYDGDILGRNASTLCAEKYAKDAYKPSVHFTPAKDGWSLKDFLIYQDPGWRHNWTIMVLTSFIGAFGMFDVLLNETVNKIYVLFLMAGGAGMLLMFREFYLHKTVVTVQIIKKEDETSKTRIKQRTVHRIKGWDCRQIFNLAMLATMITPVILFFYYAYFNDLQAQGRYIISAVYPVMYFITCGYEKILAKCRIGKKVSVWFYRGVSIVWVAGAFLTYFCVILPAYH